MFRDPLLSKKSNERSRDGFDVLSSKTVAVNCRWVAETNDLRTSLMFSDGDACFCTNHKFVRGLDTL